MDSSNSLVNDFVNNSIRGCKPENICKLVRDLVGSVMYQVESALLLNWIGWEVSDVD